MQRNLLIIFIALLTVLLPMTASCQQRKSSSLKVKVLETIPHGTNIYTQGLFIEGDILYESSGQYGSSFFRSANLKTGQTLKTFALPSNYFAEGAVMLNDKIYLLTWMEKIVFVIDKNSFKEIGKLNNPREGWGLTTDGTYLIMSDGSHNL
ncbi:MAG: glutaminyl-peptide cyclotransferase, partial [Bacteroidales bacterium]